MKTIDDLVAFVDLVLTPGFDIGAAQKRVGVIDRWIGEVAYVKDSDPALSESAIETLKGRLCGVQTLPKPPLELPWADLEKALGKPQERIQEVDNFSGRVTYRFERHVGDRNGIVYLYAKRGEDPARIDFIIVRPDLT